MSTPASPVASFSLLVARVRAQLSGALPGIEAQRVMAPLPRRGWRHTDNPQETRQAAALLLLYPIGVNAHLALTVRASHLPQHAGQVCLPGGAVEPGESLEAAALREASEEVGIEPAEVEVLGHLSALHIPVSGFVLHPVVAAIDRQPSFVPSVREVARVLHVPLSTLCDASTVKLSRSVRNGRHDEVPLFRIDGETVWGATAMVLSEFLTLLGTPPRRPTQPSEEVA